MTMRELAKMAGVSVSTVSKAFNGANDIGEETRQKILEIAKQEGCLGKYKKQKYEKKAIAIICPELGSEYYQKHIQCLQDVIEKNGGIAIVSTDNFSKTKQTELIDYYANYLRADGIIVFNFNGTVKSGCETPIVSIGGKDDRMVDNVFVDFKDAIDSSIKLLKQHNHKNIAFIGESRTMSKQQLFEDCVRENGLNLIRQNIVVSNERFENAGRDGMEKLLNTPDRCTAVVCAYDSIAIGAMDFLKQNGYSIPKDFSIIGMDNIKVDEYLEHRLTTINSRTQEICAIAYDILRRKLDSRYFRARQKITVPCELVVRETVADRS